MARASMAEEVRAFVEDLKAKLPKDSSPTGYAIPSTWVRRTGRGIAKRLHRGRLSTQIRELLEEELLKAGIAVDQPLTDVLALEQSYRFSLLPFAPQRPLFSDEKQLKALVLDAIGRAEELRHLKVKKQEYETTDGRIDILCEERERGGALVIVELKKKEPGDRVLGQLLRYHAALAQDWPGRKVKALVICGPNEDMRMTSQTDTWTWPVEWVAYDIQLKPIHRRPDGTLR